jgi:hypothetical protein
MNVFKGLTWNIYSLHKMIDTFFNDFLVKFIFLNIPSLNIPSSCVYLQIPSLYRLIYERKKIQKQKP